MSLDGLMGPGISHEEQARQKSDAALRYGAIGRASFRQRLKRACEDAVLIFVKYALVLGLWLATGYFVWNQLAIVVAQARDGKLAHQYLQQNFKEIDGLIQSRKQIDAAVAKTQEPKK